METEYEHTFTFNVKPLSYYKTIRKSRYGNIYLTPAGREFRKTILDSLKEQMKDQECECYSSNVELFICFYHDNKRKNDLDNNMKTLGDSLNCILFDDDCLIKRLVLEKDYDKKNPRIVMKIRKLDK